MPILRPLQRRAVLGAALAAPAALTATAAKAAIPPAPAPKTYVLVHGSWLGGWSWRRVADRLRAEGHQVFTPTMTGVGERRHLISHLVTLDTWVDDVVAVLESEELSDIILVGHSFGGRVVTGVADRLPDRIRAVVFLDSALAQSGKSLLDQMPAEARAERVASTAPSGGMSIPPPSAVDLGVLDPADQAWVDRRMTPQPLGTNAGAITFKEPIGAGKPVTFVEFTDPVYPASQRAVAFARAQTGWTIASLATGHMAMISTPAPLARLLLAIA